MKKCTKCGTQKPLTEFSKNKTKKDGLQFRCKTCIAQHYAENKEKIAQYRAKNKEKILEQKAQYRAENKEKILERAVQYYAENKEKIAQYRSENKEKIAQYYAQRNSEQPSCVYQIKNLINNKVYIGETIRGELRWKEHLAGLRGNYHKNSPLQEDFNKYGEEAFEWSILKEFEDEDKNNLLLEEARSIQQHIDEGIELYNLMLTIDQLKMLTEEK